MISFASAVAARGQFLGGETVMLSSLAWRSTTAARTVYSSLTDGFMPGCQPRLP
jgi:hypothetical protein